MYWIEPSARAESSDSVVRASPISSASELHLVSICKGEMGFGFKIADSAFGQRIREVVDRPRCGTMQEGDIVVQINGVKVGATVALVNACSLRVPCSVRWDTVCDG